MRRHGFFRCEGFGEVPPTSKKMHLSPIKRARRLTLGSRRKEMRKKVFLNLFDDSQYVVWTLFPDLYKLWKCVL